MPSRRHGSHRRSQHQSSALPASGGRSELPASGDRKFRKRLPARPARGGAGPQKKPRVDTPKEEEQRSRALTSPSTRDESSYSDRHSSSPEPPGPAKSKPPGPAKSAKAASGASRRAEAEAAAEAQSLGATPKAKTMPVALKKQQQRANTQKAAASGASSGASRPALKKQQRADTQKAAASGASSGASRPAPAAASRASRLMAPAEDNTFEICEEPGLHHNCELRTDSLCCFDWRPHSRTNTTTGAQIPLSVFTRNSLIIPHHEVGFGYVRLDTLLDTLMSHEICAKKKLRHLWELASESDSVDRDCPWPPVHMALWRDVPAKPQKGVGKGDAAVLTSNPLDLVFGLIALHTGEFRHWAYQTVWWNECPGAMPASGGIPVEFSIADDSQEWRAEMTYVNYDTHADPTMSRPVAAPDLARAQNTLLAPATQGPTHFRAMHLVLGLAELFMEYAFEATASQIYKAFLQNDIVVHKRTRQQRSGAGALARRQAVSDGSRR